jgi:hypothetical protein
VSCIRGQDHYNNPMLISPINKLHINITRMPIDKKEASCTVALWLRKSFKVLLKPL